MNARLKHTSLNYNAIIQYLESTRCAGQLYVRERQGAFLSPLRHMEQLLLVPSCDSPAGIGASLRTHTGRTLA